MKVYFPQWQGAGLGKGIEAGAKTILQYLKDTEIESVPLSSLAAGENGKQQYHINNFDALTEQLGRLKQAIVDKDPETLHTIGGDCGLEIVPVSFLNAKYPNLGVIWFDAHGDINRPSDSASCNFHGMPLRTLLGEGAPQMDDLLFSTIQEHQIHYVGLRDIDEAEQLRLDKGGIYHPKVLDIANLVETLRSKDIRQLYLHFDVDCLEPTDYSKTYYQVSNGLSVAAAETCITTLKKEFHVIGTSILESVTTDMDELGPIKNIIKLLFP